MGVLNTGAWLLVFVSMFAIGAAGIRFALMPLVCAPMDRMSKTLFVIGGVCALGSAGIQLLPLDAAF